MTDLKNYVAVTGAYWAFTLTDGALRMMVLLHFHTLGFAPLDLAYLFLFYEAMGVVTNFLGGWIGARYGLKLTLFAGLTIQIGALLMLSAVNVEWTLALSVAYVMVAQALSGIAKDLTKMSSKSAVKLVVTSDGDDSDALERMLFKWVALLTGSKNALKGIGFFLGGLMLTVLGFQLSLWLMAGLLAFALIIAVAAIRGDLGKAKKKIRGGELFSKSREINFLSAARIFLFASRDVWFVVGLPVSLYSALGWSFDQVGAFMAAWVIGYGFVQAFVPRIIKLDDGQSSATTAAIAWCLVLTAVPALIALALDPSALGAFGWEFNQLSPTLVLIVGLAVFGIIFAVNSSLHSYLIVAFSDHDKVALNVGFYYMANAIGRFIGTLLSGLVFQFAGLTACLWVSAGLLALALLFTLPLRQLRPARA